MRIWSQKKECERAWRGGGDYRIVCSCQHSSRSESWRRALSFVSRGVAVAASIPLAMAAFDLPIEAMDLNIPSIEQPASAGTVPKTMVTADAAPSVTQRAIFTTRAVREGFLSGERPLTLEVFKERYFHRSVPYGSIIYREAMKNRLAPELVAAMVHTESDFRPKLVSNKSAQGLMQLVPGTARILGVSNPLDPEENIAAGTRYFRYLLERFDDETMALAAYNAGEGNVARFGGVPPFAETRAYIERVNRRTSRYRERVRGSYLTSLRIRTETH